MFNQIALLALASFVGMASADKTEFPLVYVCLGITIVGIIIALYVAYKRPEELHLPGSTVMTAQETDSNGNTVNAKAYNEPTGVPV